MRIFILVATFFIMLTLNAQVSSSHKLTIGLGHEWNAFLSPSSLQVDDEMITKEELWDNGTFQSIALGNTFKGEARRHRLKLKVNGSLGIYQTEQNSNRYTFRVEGSYRLKYASGKYLEFAPSLFRKKRQGLNQDNAVLATPFSYVLAKIPVGLDFYLGKKKWVKTEVGFLYKEYDKPAGERLYYQAPYLESTISKKWESVRSVRKLSLKSTTQLRTYTTRSLIGNQAEEEDIELLFRNGGRNWTYQFTSLLLDVSHKRHAQNLTLGFYHVSRFDRRNRSTYHELGPGIKYARKLPKWHFLTSARYTVRSYTRLAPGAGNNTPLQYHYVRANVEVSYPVQDNGRMYLKGNLIRRSSNNPTEESLAFREYQNGFIELGLRWRW